MRACEAAGFTPAIRYVSRDPLANRGLVAAGLAVTISPAELAAEFTGIAVEPLRDGPEPRTSTRCCRLAAPRRARRALVAAPLAGLTFLDASLAAGRVVASAPWPALRIPAHPAAAGHHPRASVPALGLPLTPLRCRGA